MKFIKKHGILIFIFIIATLYFSTFLFTNLHIKIGKYEIVTYLFDKNLNKNIQKIIDLEKENILNNEITIKLGNEIVIKDNAKELGLEIKNISKFDKLSNLSYKDILFGKDLYYKDITFDISFKDKKSLKEHLLKKLNKKELNFLKINNFEYSNDKLDFIGLYGDELNIIFDDEMSNNKKLFYYLITIPKNIKINIENEEEISLNFLLDNNVDKFSSTYLSKILNLNKSIFYHSKELNEDILILNLNRLNFQKYIKINNSINNTFSFSEQFFIKLNFEISNNLINKGIQDSKFSITKINGKNVTFLTNNNFENQLKNIVLFDGKNIILNFENSEKSKTKSFDERIDLPIPENISNKERFCYIINGVGVDNHILSKINGYLYKNKIENFNNYEKNDINNDLNFLSTILFYYKIPLLNISNKENNIFGYYQKDRYDLFYYIPNFYIDFFNDKNKKLIINYNDFLISCNDNKTISIFSNKKPINNIFGPIKKKGEENWIIDYGNIFKTINLFSKK